MEWFQTVSIFLILLLVIFVIVVNSKEEPKYFLWGSYLANDIVPVERIEHINGENVYMAFHDKYTKMVTQSGVGKYYEGLVDQFDISKWDSYNSVPKQAYNFRVCSSKCIKGCTANAKDECL